MRADGAPAALTLARATAFGSNALSALASPYQRPNRTSGSGSRSVSSNGRSGGSGIGRGTLSRSAAAAHARHRNGLPGLQAALAGAAGDAAEGVASALEVDPHAVRMSDHACLALGVRPLVTAAVRAREAGRDCDAGVVAGGPREVLICPTARDGARISLAGHVAEPAVELTRPGSLT